MAEPATHGARIEPAPFDWQVKVAVYAMSGFAMVATPGIYLSLGSLRLGTILISIIAITPHAYLIRLVARQGDSKVRLSLVALSAMIVGPVAFAVLAGDLFVARPDGLSRMDGMDAVAVIAYQWVIIVVLKVILALVPVRPRPQERAHI